MEGEEAIVGYRVDVGGPRGEVLESQKQRDARDAARDIAPMVPAVDAVILDTTALGLDEVIATMEQEVRRRMPRKDVR